MHVTGVTASELARLPCLAGIDRRSVERIVTTVTRRRFKRGETICVEGERRPTALLMEDGDALVRASSRPGFAVAAGRWFVDWLRGAGRPRITTLDRPRERPTGAVIGRVVAGDLWAAECATRHHPNASAWPRPASLVAASDGSVLEVTTPFLSLLRDLPRYRSQLDRAFSRPGADVELVGEPLSAEEIAAVPIFGVGAGPGLISIRALRDYPGMVVRRRIAPGEVVCRQGEFGSTAFYVVEGVLDVTVATERTGEGPAHPPDATGPAGTADDPGAAQAVGTVVANQIFGEMTCINFYPRSATVTARTPCVVLELLRWFVDQLLREGHPFKVELDRTYRAHALAADLRSVTLFDGVPASVLAPLVERARFQTYSPVTVTAVRTERPVAQVPTKIVQEGDPADSLILIRSGTVKVTQGLPGGGEWIVGHLGRGEHAGGAGMFSPERLHTQTLVPMDRVEVIRLMADDLAQVLRLVPEVRVRLIEAAQRERVSALARTLDLTVGFRAAFIGEGLAQAQDVLLLDLDRCTRCDECVQACADSHGGVARFVREGVKLERYLITNACRSCRDPLCMIGCPVGAIRRSGGKEVLIEDWCIGCGKCVTQCPFDALRLHDLQVVARDESGAQDGALNASVKRVALGCDLCHRLEGGPRCVLACPHEAAVRADPREHFRQYAGGAETWRGKGGTGG